jgi:hypothetical protein
MKSCIFSTLLVFSFLFAETEVIVKNNEAQNSTTYSMVGNVLAANGIYSSPIELNLVCVKSNVDNTWLYTILLYYSGISWLELKEGESLVIIIDGEETSLHTFGEIEKNITYLPNGEVFIEEGVYYMITPDLVGEMIAAEKVEAKVMGKYTHYRYFTSENLENFRDYYNKYMKDVGSSDG